ncbi:MAG: hypothetical protein ACE5Q6_04970 [Dehalococcoidia bacterium]
MDWAKSVTFNGFGTSPGVQPDEVGALVGVASGANHGFLSLDVTSSLAAWSADPSANRGWVFQPTGANGVRIWSSEYDIVAKRPQLSVDFLLP